MNASVRVRGLPVTSMPRREIIQVNRDYHCNEKLTQYSELGSDEHDHVVVSLV